MRAAKAGPTSWIVLAAGLAQTLAGVSVARMEPEGTVDAGPATSGVVRCPEAEAVQAALRKLAARDDPERLVTAAADAKLEVEDLGGEMRVSVGGRRRAYRDPGRDCERRARLAALFAALVLTPGSRDESADDVTDEVAPPRPPASPLPPAAQPVAIAPISVTKADGAAGKLALGAGPVLAIAPNGGSALVSTGVLVGALRGFASWQVAMTVAVPVLPATFSIGSTAVSLARYPVRLSVGRALDLGAVRAAVQVGAVVSVLRLERTGPAPTTTATRVEGGVHVGAEGSLPIGRWTVYLAAASDLIPRTYPITLDPEGEVERTPALWLSGEVGLRFVLD